MITIRTAGTDHIDVIHTLAHRTWRIAYKEMISPEQLEYMLKMMYSHDSLQYQMQEQQHTFIIAYDDEVPVGFAAYYPKYDISPTLYRLDKLYVLTDQHGKGIGKKLVDYIISAIKPLGASILELTVNRRNKSLSFYQKLGFTIVSEIDHPIGEGFFMNDYVMQKSLSTSPSTSLS